MKTQKTSIHSHPSHDNSDNYLGTFLLRKSFDKYIDPVKEIFWDNKEYSADASFLLTNRNLYLMFTSQSRLTYILFGSIKWSNEPPPSITMKAYKLANTRRGVWTVYKSVFKKHGGAGVTVSASPRSNQETITLHLKNRVEEAVKASNTGRILEAIAQQVEKGDYYLLLRLNRSVDLPILSGTAILASNGLGLIDGVVYEGFLETLIAKRLSSVKINLDFMTNRTPMGFRLYPYFNIGLIRVAGNSYFYFYDPGKRVGFITNDNKLFEDASTALISPTSIGEYVLAHPEVINYISLEAIPESPLPVWLASHVLARKIIIGEAEASGRSLVIKTWTRAFLVDKPDYYDLKEAIIRTINRKIQVILGETYTLIRTLNTVKSHVRFTYKRQPTPHKITLYTIEHTNLPCLHEDTAILARRLDKEATPIGTLLDRFFSLNMDSINIKQVKLEGLSEDELSNEMELLVKIEKDRLILLNYFTLKTVAEFEVDGEITPLPEVSKISDAWSKGLHVIMLPIKVLPAEEGGEETDRYNLDILFNLKSSKKGYVSPSIAIVVSRVNTRDNSSKMISMSIANLDKLAII